MDHIRILLLNILLDVGLQNVRRHRPLGGVGIENFLFQIKAIFAIEIADWTDGLGENVKRRCADRSHLMFRSIARWSFNCGIVVNAGLESYSHCRLERMSCMPTWHTRGAAFTALESV